MKDGFYDEFIEQLRSRSDLVTLISEYVPLKKRGRNYWGCCPFHHEKTPSFSVTPDKGFFYCFGCQSGGNIFNFIMKIENLAFFEAVKFLANKLGVQLPEREKSPQDRQRERDKADLYRANAMARDFFYACLTKTGYGQAAREYLQQRGITPEVIATYQLGFAPPNWNKLTEALLKRGFEPEVLVKAGLSVPQNSGDGFYDRFRGRIIFPIIDHQDRVLGFGGRVLDNSQPKYLNSPETLVFNKRHLLYGFNTAYQAIRQQGKAVVVEGYMDLIAAQTSGRKNTVASLGTAFTPEQAKRLLSGHAREIIFAYDSDSAGQNATLRALTTVRTLGLNVRVVSIPDGKDPDDFIRKHGAEEFGSLLDNAQALLDYQVSQAILSTDYSTLEGKVTVVAKAVPALAEAENAVEVNAYIAKLSQLLAIDESAIRTEVSKFITGAKKDLPVSRGQTMHLTGLGQQLTTALAGAERHLIRLMVEDHSIIPYVEAQITLPQIQNEHRRAIASALFAEQQAGESSSPEMLAINLPELAANELSAIMMMDIQLIDISRMVDDCLKIINLEYYQQKYEEHRLRAHELERMGDSNFLQELAESQRIKDEISKIYQSK